MLAVPLILLLVLFIWMNVMFGRIERVDVGDALSSGSGTNYLIVGTDRDETDPTRPGGERADTIMVLHFGSDGTRMLPIPRDLFVVDPADGTEGRINGTYDTSAQNLLEAVSSNLDIPINRYMEVDFNSFGGLVDGLGGVTIDFEHPASDPMTGLWIEGRGPQHLDGEEALQYVRSRQYTEHIRPGQLEVDGSGDIGRVQRQQRFLSAVFQELDTSNPFTLVRAFSNVTGGLRIDDKMSLIDAMYLAWRMRGLDISDESMLILPTVPFTTSGGAQVLGLDETGAADEVLDQVR